MNNSKISLNTLRKLADYSQKNNDIGLCEILNSFDGDSTYEKFINILTIWSEDVDD